MLDESHISIDIPVVYGFQYSIFDTREMLYSVKRNFILALLAFGLLSKCKYKLAAWYLPDIVFRERIILESSVDVPSVS